MDVSRRRVGVRCSVVAGSVWESRMKSDEIEGGVKVFSGEENAEERGVGGNRLKRNQIGGVVATGKRKTWKSELDKSQIQIARGKSEPHKNSGEQCKDLSVSSDAIKKSPIKVRKLKTEGSKEIGASADKFERSSIHKVGECPERLGKRKSDPIKTEKQSVKNVAGFCDGNGENTIQLREEKSEFDQVLDESRIEKDDIDENSKDFGACQDNVISSSSDNAGVVKCSPVHVDGDSDDFIDDEADEGEEKEEEEELMEEDDEIDIEMEKRSFDVKEISIPESKVVNEPERKVVVNETGKHKIVNQQESKKAANTNTRYHQKNERPVSVPLTVKQSPPIKRHSTIYQNFSKADSIPKAEEYHSFPQTQNKLQTLVDLIMWRDISRSAFIFGIGTFIIVSSTYAEDINLSLISVMSYMGLVYLAVIFLHRSLVCRGVIDVKDTNYVLGEEEAIWVLKLILPYLNEFLSKLRAMFSGDPGTTIKLAVLLFVLARCGSSITIWKMVKFGFFGVFTVPKICSSYSAQLTAYANFWIRRFRDAWDSCSHKKAVALGIFGLVWNFSSVVARIWSVFVLFVAFRYYQQHYMVRDEWVEDEAGCDETWQETFEVEVGVGMQRQGRAHNFCDLEKVKKGF
ncbi:reticulon-like protein B21 [Gastrolobium bilobum]|uniref:reticulon-like protein B21 n=1 Tax=Gastrolobium bilobum TaxID=150636 RepID=UPI002AB2A19F|nr:reticulon-like protein B21 [Gastrolobium bilobum]